MRKLSPKIWRDSYKWQFEAYPLFTSVYQKAAEPTKNKYFTRFNELLNNFNDGQVNIFEPRKEVFNKGMMIVRELLKGNDSFYKEFKKVFDEINHGIKICEKYRLEGKCGEVEKWWPPTQLALSDATYILFNFDYPLDDYLKNLSDKSPKEFGILSEHIYSNIPSFIDEANAKLIKLNKKYPKDFNKVRKIFIAEFGWFQNSYIGKFNLTEKWLKKHLDEIKNFHSKKIKPAGVLPKKFKLLAKTASFSIKFRDDKKKLLLLAAELMENWLRQVCRKNGWKYDAIRWLSMDEILEILNKKKFLYIKNAEKYYKNKKRIGVMESVGYKEVSEKFWNEVLKTQTPDNKIKEIRGVIANKGKYRGEARIIIDAKKEAKKFKNGDILVTSMTRPEFLPLMAKAGAFVTDEGGISCHAAIVAREMGRPCVIGTKIATKVFKDGDLVEVDADKGVVKIIKFIK